MVIRFDRRHPLLARALRVVPTWLPVALWVALAGCSGGEQAEAAPLPPVGVEEGLLAPPLEGVLPSGESFRLAGRPEQPRVVVFYRGADCGLCRERLLGLQQHLGAYRQLGADVVAVTPDPPGRTVEVVRVLGLEFPIVSVDRAALERWGVLAPGTETPRPATYLLDDRGVIRFRHLGRNAADRVSDVSLLAVLQQRAASGGW